VEPPLLVLASAVGFGCGLMLFCRQLMMFSRFAMMRSGRMFSHGKLPGCF